MTTNPCSSRLLRVALLLPLLAFAAAAPAQTDQVDATHIFITYRCKAADRPAFRRSLVAEELPRLEAWQKAEVMAEHLLVFNPVVDENTWDAQLVLRFTRFAQTARWREVERDYPGGLGAKSLALATPCTTYFADREITAGAPADRRKSTFLFIPYTFRDRAEYRNFIKVYGVPQFEAWKEQKVIANYSIFFNHHSTGKPWDVLLVFEYPDLDALARRDQVKWDVRRQLDQMPEWRLASDFKREVREEHEVVLGEALLPKP